MCAILAYSWIFFQCKLNIQPIFALSWIYFSNIRRAWLPPEQLLNSLNFKIIKLNAIFCHIYDRHYAWIRHLKKISIEIYWWGFALEIIKLWIYHNIRQYYPILDLLALHWLKLGNYFMPFNAIFYSIGPILACYKHFAWVTKIFHHGSLWTECIGGKYWGIFSYLYVAAVDIFTVDPFSLDSHNTKLRFKFREYCGWYWP